MAEPSLWWRLLVAALATWRLAHLLVVEDGPFELSARLRALVQSASPALGRALDCLHCTSLWLAAPLAAFVTTDPKLWWVVWLALSGAAGLAHRATESAPSLQLQGDPDALLRTDEHPQTRAEPSADAADATRSGDPASSSTAPRA